MASGEVGAQRLLSLCDQFAARRHRGARRRDHPAAPRTRHAPRSASSPAGTYRSSALLDLADGSEIDIVCALTVDTEAGEITVDYTGSADASPWGINVVKNYTHAYTTFTVRSVLSPEIPNNHGSLAPIKMIAPEGSIVNAVSPQPCTARHVVGHVPAERAAQGTRPGAARRRDGRGLGCGVDDAGQRQPRRRQRRSSPRCSRTPAASAPAPRSPVSMHARIPTGRRRRAHRGRRGVGPDPVPHEGVAHSVPAATVRQTGGLGQTIEFSVDTTRPWQLNAVTSRLAEPPQGIFGGVAGQAGAFCVNGEAVTTQARIDAAARRRRAPRPSRRRRLR